MSREFYRDGRGRIVLPFPEVSSSELDKALGKMGACRDARRWVRSRKSATRTLLAAAAAYEKVNSETSFLYNLEPKLYDQSAWFVWFARSYFLVVGHRTETELYTLRSDVERFRSYTRKLGSPLRNPAKTLRRYVDAVNSRKP